MTTLLMILILLIGLLIVGGLFANPLAAFVQQRFANQGHEGDQFMLLGGMLLTAFMFGLLVMYLFLRP